MSLFLLNESQYKLGQEKFVYLDFIILCFSLEVAIFVVVIFAGKTVDDYAQHYNSFHKTDSYRQE